MNTSLLKNSVFWIILTLFIIPTKSHSIKLNAGLLYGSASDFFGEAIVGYPETEFDNANILGFSVMISDKRGLGCELLVEKYEQELEELGSVFGNLKSNPILLLFKYHTIPWQNKGISFNCDIGAGINLTSFEKGYFFTQQEQQSSGVLKWTTITDNAFIFEIGLGVGYFFSKNISASFDWKFLINNVRTYWTAENLDTNISETMEETFFASTSQPMFILRYWFR